MDSRGRHFLAENASLVEEEKILRAPFFRRGGVDGGETLLECLQLKNVFDKNYSPLNGACEEPPFRSFEKLLLHFHNDHQMDPGQLEWACLPCEALFSSPDEFRDHGLLCPSSVARPPVPQVGRDPRHHHHHPLPPSVQTCQVCGQFFGPRLRQHKERSQHFVLGDVVAPLAKKHHCALCNFQEDSEAELSRHQARHHIFPRGQEGDDDCLLFQRLNLFSGFVCPFEGCHFKTLSKAFMMHHFERVHSTLQGFEAFKRTFEFYPCPKCKTRFKNSELKSHLKTCGAR